VTSKVKSKTVFLVSKKSGAGGVEPIGVLTSFRAAYQWIQFIGRISNPNLKERAALAELRKDLVTKIYCQEKSDSLEHALWTPDGTVFWISEVPLIKRGTENLALIQSTR